MKMILFGEDFETVELYVCALNHFRWDRERWGGKFIYESLNVGRVIDSDLLGSNFEICRFINIRKSKYLNIALVAFKILLGSIVPSCIRVHSFEI